MNVKNDGQIDKDPKFSEKTALKVKKGDYHVHIYLEEARGLLGEDQSDVIEPVVLLSVFDQKKYTKPKESIASGTVIQWREHFFFKKLDLTVEQIEASRILIEVRNHRMIRSDTLIGNFDIDLTYVYYQPKHALVHKWIALSNPESSDFQQIKGHIKLGIAVQTEGDDDVDLTVPEFENIKDSEILLPPQISLKPYQLIVTFIKAEGLPRLDVYLNGTIDAYCEVEFAGAKVRTKALTADSSKFAVGWYEELYLPVMMPNISKKLTIKVLDQDRGLSPDNAGCIVFDFEKVKNNEYKDLAWYNLYGTINKDSSDYAEIMNNAPALASYWNGRLLIKIEFYKCERPMLKSQYVRTPHIVEHVNENFDIVEEFEIRAHILKGVSLSDQFEEYSVTVAWGGSKITTSSKALEQKKCEWYEKLPKKIVKVPRGFVDLCDIFVYLESNEEKLCFCRLNPSQVSDMKAGPRWLNLIPDKSLGKLKNEWDGGFVQARIYIGKYSGNDMDKVGNWHIPPIPPPKNKKTQGIIFFNLYQCRDLPAADSDGQSDPYVEIYCNGVTAVSPVIENTLNPMWYTVLKLTSIIDNPEKLPPLIVYVKDKDNTKDELLGYCIYNLSDALVGSYEPARPSWKDLSFGKISGGKILASLNFYTDSEKSFEYCLEPKCFEATVEINCIGLRDLTPAVGWLPVNKAFIKFDMNSIQIPSEKINLRNVETQPGETGSNPTINTVIKFTFLMPEDKIFAPALTCIVYDYLFKGLSQPQIGVFTINLADLFQQKRVSEVMSPIISKLIENHMESLEETNINEEMIPVQPTLAQARRGIFVYYPKIIRDKKSGRLVESMKMPDTYMKLGYNRFEDDKIMHYRFALDRELEKSGYIEKSPFDIFQIKKGVKRDEGSWTSIFGSKQKLDISEYTTKIVGQFKALIRVTRTERLIEKEEKVKKIKDQREGNPEASMKDSQYEDFSDIRQLLLKKHQVVVRIYLIGCSNLAQKDLRSHSDPYIKIKLAGNVIDDSKNFQKDEPNPVFLKHFDLLAILPGASRLKIQLWDRDLLLKDEKIGETVIDLEDRYFSNSWRRLKQKPIEKRNLYSKSSAFVQGSLQMWLEIHNPSNLPEPLDLTPKPPIEFEARLIIFQTKDIESYDIEDTSDLYIRASINNCTAKETDTHYRCRDGEAQFNWRMKFLLKLPCPDYLIDIQVWDRDVFSQNDFIGAASFYFRELARDCFDRGKRIMMRGVDKEFHLFERSDPDRFWVECFGNKEGERVSVGKVQVSLELVPKVLADACPVGEGREEPNIDPYLEDPRGRFEWTLNPFKLINQTCGPRFKAKICCAFCCLLCCYLLIMITPSIIGSLIGGSNKS